MKKFLLSLAVIAAGVMSVSAQQTLTICDGTTLQPSRKLSIPLP